MYNEYLLSWYVYANMQIIYYNNNQLTWSCNALGSILRALNVLAIGRYWLSVEDVREGDAKTMPKYQINPYMISRN